MKIAYPRIDTPDRANGNAGVFQLAHALRRIEELEAERNEWRALAYAFAVLAGAECAYLLAITGGWL